MTLTPVPHVSITETDTGLVLLDERTGRYWTLNRTGATVVRLLFDGGTPEEAVAALRSEHPSAAERITEDVQRFLVSLKEARVVA